MRLAFGAMHEVTEEKLQFAAQIGVDGVIAHSPNIDQPGRGYYDFASLVNLRTQVEAAGLRLEALESMPWRLCYKWMLGLLGRDEQIENFQKTLRNMGAAGIPILSYYFCPLVVWRTSSHTIGRGGAPVTSFDMELAKDAPLMAGDIGPVLDASLIPDSVRRPIGDDEMWENFTYFLKAVVPVAEEAE